MSLIPKLHRFIGHNVYDVSGELEKVVTESGYRLNIQDPQYAPFNIDVETDRLNCVLNVEGIIVSFKIG